MTGKTAQNAPSCNNK